MDRLLPEVSELAKKDQQGYIRYSQEELQRIPSFEARTEGGTPPIAGLGGGTLGMLAGGTAGSALGPGGAIAGMAGGAIVGNQMARAAGRGQGGTGREMREKQGL